MDVQEQGMKTGHGPAGRMPRIAGGRGPEHHAPRPAPPPHAPTSARDDGARLFDDDEIAAHLESSLDLSLFEPESVQAAPAPPQPLGPDTEPRGLLPDFSLPTGLTPRASGAQVSPLGARRIGEARPRTRSAWAVALAAAALGAAVGYQVSALVSWFG